MQEEQEEHQDAHVEKEEEEPVLESADLVQFRDPLARPTAGTGVLLPPLGTHFRASRWCGSVRRLSRKGSGTGTGAPVPALTLCLLYLLSEAFAE